MKKRTTRIEPSLAFARVQEALTVEVDDGVRLYVERAGTGRPALLLDGLLCEGHVWKYLTQGLEGELDAVHFHYPGHGHSSEPPPFGRVDPERLAADALAVLDAVGVERAVVLGHSLGVQVALELAHRQPERVAALVLICGSPGQVVSNFHGSELLRHLTPVLALAAAFLPQQVTRLVRALPAETLLWLALRSREINTRLVRTADLAQYLGRLGRVEFGLFLRLLEAAGRHDATPYLRQIHAPTLIVAGEEDRFTPAYRSLLMHELIPGAELLMVPGGTHSLPIEQPDIVSLRVRKFLAERL